jgi:PAS domain S-box-containing protein
MADKKHEDQKRNETNNDGTSLAANDQFHLLVQNVNSFAIFLHDTDGRIVYWNPGAEQILGYRSEEIIGQNISMLYPKEEVAAGIPQREIKLALAPGRAEAEGWRLRKDGSRFWAEVTIIAMHDQEHRLLGFGKIIRDATERRNADSSLKKSRTMFERLFENAPDAIIVVDSRGVIRKVNQQVEPFFGYLREP